MLRKPGFSRVTQSAQTAEEAFTCRGPRDYYAGVLMAPFPVVTDQRQSTRAPLNLPVRLRWQGALGQTVEVTQTLDSSRSGLLFYRTQAMAVNTRVWVTCPYSPESRDPMPETPARVVRVKTTPGGGQLVALMFDAPSRPAPLAGGPNLRAATRLPLALPLNVRLDDLPWPEQAMTSDISDSGVSFLTPRVYHHGEVVRVSVAHGAWGRRGEAEARVVRVDPLPNSVEHRVALTVL